VIIIGHPWIKSSHFCKVFSIDDIKKSSPNDIVLLDVLCESHSYAVYCQENAIVYAVWVDSLNDALFANALGAKYIICNEKNALQVQPIAQEYLFDMRVLVCIDNENEISRIASAGIDGVIFSSMICND